MATLWASNARMHTPIRTATTVKIVQVVSRNNTNYELNPVYFSMARLY